MPAEAIPAPVASQNWKNMNESDKEQIEWGYVWMEHCRLCFVDGESGNTGGNVALKEWIDVDVLYDDDYDEMKLSHTNRTGRQRPLEDLPEVKGDIDDSLSAKFCSRCNLVLYQSGPMGSNLKVRLNEIPPCQGTTKDFLGTDECSCIVSRSDACLIMGVMRTCASVARVQHCSILRESDSQEPTFTLVISVAFPHLLHGPGGRRNIMALKDYRRAYKPLHTTTQLILSILRSDWKNLISMMEKMRLAPTIKVENRRVPRFFPNRLGLDELYERIQGTAATHMMLETRREDQLRNQRNDCLIVQLPKDVFTDYLAPFLKPRSLDALRCSCSYLHNTLRAVVPGLKLRLYSHQVSSLIWMRNRETNLLSEKDCLSTTPLPDSPDRDLHRMVTGGYTTLLRSRCPLSDLSIRIDQKTGFEIVPKDLTTLPRTVARGGLLCDDPGLGKTVTVLSLIMQTAGLSTKANDTVDTSVSKQLMPMEDAIFRTYWNEQMTPEFRRPLLHRFLNAFVRQSSGGFIGQADQVKRNIDLDKYDLNFSLFERDMTEAIFPQTWEGKHEDNDSETHVYRNAARQLKSEFLANVEEFKQTQLQSARKSFSSVSAKPNSRVAALLDRSEQLKFVDSLVSSSATLLVVPAVLLDHWQAQIDLNLDLSYCTDKIPLIFEFGRKHKGLTMEAVCAICKDNGSHFPMVFIDRGGTKKLPAPEFLAMFQIVITTTQRFSQEWRNGSFQAELRSSGCKEGSKLYLDSAFDRSESACPLLKIHWLRMIVDEGHSMAKNQNSTIQFASWISAERRWAMTGTPTKQSATQIQQIYAMLRFLGHGFFTPRLDGNAVWTSNVARCWKEGSFAAFFRLRSLLGLLMKRHTKRDIAELELPCCSAELIPMSFVEVTTYNTLVCGVQSNILLTSMSGKTSGLQDSLLHRSQVRHARAALSNLRRVCVGYSRVLPTLETRFYIETMVLLKEHGRDDRQIQNVKEYLHRAEAQELSECDCCQIKLSTLLLFPCCGGFLCPECMDEKSNICVLCDQDFDVDEFQRLQPGFSLKWLETMIESERRKPKPSISNANVQVDPPGGGDPIMRAEIELPNGVLVRPNMELRRTRRLGDGHECQFDRYTVHGKCILCLSEHSSCNLFNDNARCAICFRAAEECSEEESKSFYLVKRLSELHQQLRNNEQRRPLKIIVFSQFRQALNMAGNRLLRKFGTACIAEYWGSFRTTELRKFTYDRDCFCMLLGRDGSEGLDLSFVTHIFFLEEIMDQSLRDQAIARAWRMGAKGRVRVVTLTAAKTVEETMQEIESAAQYRFQYSHQTVTRPIVAAAESNNLEEYATAKTHALLRSLRLITDYHHFSAEPRTSTAEKATCLNNKIPGISKESDKTVDNPPVKRRKK